MSKKQRNIAIIGAGAFGTALGMTCHRAGHDVTFYVKDEKQAEEISKQHTNTSYFPKAHLPHGVKATTDLSALMDAKAILIAVPAQTLPALFSSLKHRVSPHIPLILTSKGIVEGTPLPLFPSDLAKAYLENPIALLSGPNFAIELVDHLPAAASLACDTPYQKELSELFTHELFRIYPTSDIMGLQIAGVLKNILAIGCGAVAGQNLGQNAMAALMTRGLAEMTRLGLRMGATMETFLGLGGVGDLFLTCSSSKSRNFSLGVKLAKGQSVEKILEEGHPLSEGYHNLNPILTLAAYYKVDMPLCQAVREIVHGKSLRTVMKDLFERPLRFQDFCNDERAHVLAP